MYEGGDDFAGKFIVNESKDIDEYISKLDSIKNKSKKIVQFILSSKATCNNINTKAKVINFKDAQKLKSEALSRQDDLICKAYKKQRADFENKIRTNKIEQFYKLANSIMSSDLEFEEEVKLDILINEFKAYIESDIKEELKTDDGNELYFDIDHENLKYVKLENKVASLSAHCSVLFSMMLSLKEDLKR